MPSRHGLLHAASSGLSALFMLSRTQAPSNHTADGQPMSVTVTTSKRLSAQISIFRELICVGLSLRGKGTNRGGPATMSDCVTTALPGMLLAAPSIGSTETPVALSSCWRASASFSSSSKTSEICDCLLSTPASCSTTTHARAHTHKHTLAATTKTSASNFRSLRKH
eukprot:172049-Rhodomonas_salina.1